MRLGRASAYAMLAMLSIAESSVQKRASKNGHHGHLAHSNGNGHGSNGHGGNGQQPKIRALQISQATGIPVEYLRKVLQRLSRARLVHSERGRAGGFTLAKPATKVTLLQIVEAIDGPVDDSAFLGDGLSTSRASRSRHPRLRAWRRHTTEEMRELLNAQSLAGLLE